MVYFSKIYNEDFIFRKNILNFFTLQKFLKEIRKEREKNVFPLKKTFLKCFYFS